MYNNFDEMLGFRDVINLRDVKGVGRSLSPNKTDDAEKRLQPGSLVLDLSK